MLVPRNFKQLNIELNYYGQTSSSLDLCLVRPPMQDTLRDAGWLFLRIGTMVDATLDKQQQMTYLGGGGESHFIKLFGITKKNLGRLQDSKIFLLCSFHTSYKVNILYDVAFK